MQIIQEKIYQHERCQRTAREGTRLGEDSQGRPDPAVATRHMGKIANDESTVVSRVTHEANAVAARSSRRDDIG